MKMWHDISKLQKNRSESDTAAMKMAIHGATKNIYIYRS